MAKRLAKRVMLIGWDAADWQIIKPLMDKGAMPNLKRFVDGGAWGNIATLNPVLSPMLWNSIATGKLADKHDILGFTEPDGEGGVRPVASTSRKAKAIWNILNQHGMRSVVNGWFASHPAEKINGAVVTDRYEAMVDNPDAFIADKHAYHPEYLAEALREMHVSKEGILLEQAKVFVPDIESIDTSKDSHPGALAHLLAQCVSVHNAATYMIETEEWDFAGLYYTAIDHFGHAFQHFHPPAMQGVPPEHVKLYGNVIISVYQFHDLMLGRLIELAGEDTTFILMSDHGFKSGEDRPLRRITRGDAESELVPSSDPVSWHRQFGVIAAMGPGIATDGREVRGATLLDVCPTVLTLLGVPVGRDMDGKVFTPLFAEPPKPDYVETHEGEHPDDAVHRGEHVVDPYAAQEVLKQLVDLGYIEAPGEDKEQSLRRCMRSRNDVLATVLFTSGRIGEAANVLEELYKDRRDPQTTFRYATALSALGRGGEFVRVLNEMEATSGHTPFIDFLKGQAAIIENKPEEAIELFERVVKTMPHMPRVRSLLARPLIHLERWDRAEEVLRDALAVNADDPEALDLLGVVLASTDRVEDAVHAHMKSVTLLHEQPMAHHNLGAALSRLGKWEWAIEAFTHAVNLAPNSVASHMAIAKIARDVLGDAARAEKHERLAAEADEMLSKASIDQQIMLGRWFRSHEDEGSPNGTEGSQA